jgi:hypothetical protein
MGFKIFQRDHKQAMEEGEKIITQIKLLREKLENLVSERHLKKISI